MNSSTYRPRMRFALALGLVAASWLMSSASTAGVDAPLPASTAASAAGPAAIQLAQAGAAPVKVAVTYADEQADRGQTRYTAVCEECHGEDLGGGMNGGPPLRGLGFEQKFAAGAPASALFLFMSTAMPPESPGRYSASAYADLMAYVLKHNGFAAGAPLPSDVDALDQLVMEK